MSKKLIIRLTVMLNLLFLIVPLSAETLTPVTIELKWFHQFQFAGIYAAKERGIYKKYGLDVTILERNVDSSPLNDVLDGKVQFGISDSTIIKDYIQGKPVVILAAIFQHSPLVLISPKHKNIISPLELKGKKVMYQKNVDEAIIYAMFKEFNLNSNDFTYVPHTFKDDAILTEDIDAMSAYITNQPFFFQEKNIPINIIDPSNYGIDFYGDMIFTSLKYFKNHKHVALKFRKATIEGWYYALKHPDEIVRIIKNKYGAKKSIKALKYEAEKTKKMIASDFIDIGTINYNRLKRIFQIYKKQENLKKIEDIKPLLYTHYLRPYSYRKLILYGSIVILTFLLMLIFLFVFNRQLSKRVKKQHAELLFSNQKSQKLLDILDTHVMSLHVTPTGQIIHVSKDFASKLAINKEILLTKNIFDLIDKKHTDAIKKISRHLSNKKQTSGDMVLVSGHNENLYLSYKMFWLNLEKERFQYLIVCKDLTAQREIRKISETDALTKIPNRYKADQQLNSEISRSRRYQIALSLAIIDIDHFKSINDTLGHAFGDEILIELANHVKSLIRKEDFFARWGGEEFILIMPHTTAQEAQIACEKIRHHISLFQFKKTKKITVSIGIAQLQSNELSQELFIRADKALYQAKSSGRNCIFTDIESN